MGTADGVDIPYDWLQLCGRGLQLGRGLCLGMGYVGVAYGVGVASGRVQRWAWLSVAPPPGAVAGFPAR